MITSTAYDRPILVFNEDNSAYASGRKYGGPLTEEGLRGYVRRIASGGHFTHFFMCPNAMCVNWASSVMDPIWAAFDRPGARIVDWQRGVKALHDAGIDMYAVWIDEARKCGLSPWLSIRMNDVHCTDDPDCGMHSSFWLAHPEFRRVPSSNGIPNTDAALDYSHIEVRDYWKAFLAEAFGRYDIDGLELDWMRFPEHLPPGREAEFSWCLDEVVAEARRLADAASARLGRKVMVGVRVSSRPETAHARGTDFETWARGGWVDWIVPCNFFQNVDFGLPYAEWARLVADVNPNVLVVPGLDNGVMDGGRRRTLTSGEYAAFASAMYRQGAPGIYVFNPFDNTPAVWESLISNGLPPEGGGRDDRHDFKGTAQLDDETHQDPRHQAGDDRAAIPLLARAAVPGERQARAWPSRRG